MKVEVEYQLDHTEVVADRLESYIMECMHRRIDDAENVTPICDICEERMVELSIRKEWDIILTITYSMASWLTEREGVTQ